MPEAGPPALPDPPAPSDFWPDCGWHALRADERGWLHPGDDYLRWLLGRPELALVAESCPAEIALHQALRAQPRRPVTAAELAALADADARSNYAAALDFRDRLLASGTLQACYCGLFSGARITLAPVFIDLMVQAILRQLLDDGQDAYEARAAELLFRPQRITVEQGRVLAADRQVLDELQASGGYGTLGRLLAQAQVAVRSAPLAVLGPDNQLAYWHDGGRHRHVLDLTHTVPTTLAHGLQVPLVRSHSGLAALARVLQRWVAHLLGVTVTITPQAQIADERWRWHLGLDVESSALLDALYRGDEVDEGRLQRLIGLFRLEFANPADMQADVAGKPVYLGLAMDAEGSLRLKPQNLLLNLPLARRA